MSFKIVWSPSARVDLWDLHEYISTDDPVAADRFICEILDLVTQLSLYPLSGRVVPEFEDDEIRELIVAPCRIVYRLNNDEDTVELARVWHSARGIPEM